MNFDDDFVRLHTAVGTKNILLSSLGLDWPPPERISVNGTPFERIRMSDITDKQRADLTHVCRGAEYKIFQH